MDQPKPRRDPKHQLKQAIERSLNTGLISMELARELTDLFVQAISGRINEHREIQINDANRTLLIASRISLSEAINMAHSTLHTLMPLQPGQQWTIELESPCGFAGRLVFQVDNLGSCEPEEEVQQIVQQLDTLLAVGQGVKH